VIGDGALSKDVLVMFPGTGEILPEWPVQLLTNSTYSPEIVNVPSYRKSEDGTVSLCHDYRIVLFDYPGVGRSPSTSTATLDAVANDVDRMLTDVSDKFGIPTNIVDPAGWSLGTSFALKYAYLSPVARPARTIHNVILYSAGPGGSEQAQAGMNSAPCVATLFEASLSASGGLSDRINQKLSELIFPYQGQGPKQSGTNSGCTARVSSDAVALNVVPDCTTINGCKQYLAANVADATTYPWSITKGADEKVYALQREQANDWGVAHCSKAGPNFTSTQCTVYGTVKQSRTNGGICKTDTSNPDEPVSSGCVSLTISGKVTLVDGYEDLLVQWTYDKAVANGLNLTHPKQASLVIYPGLAGHGVMFEHPRWTQARTFEAMQQ
jgi:pimeloyl-ACP methyl ester carboxylesterase